MIAAVVFLAVVAGAVLGAFGGLWLVRWWHPALLHLDGAVLNSKAATERMNTATVHAETILEHWPIARLDDLTLRCERATAAATDARLRVDAIAAVVSSAVGVEIPRARERV
jgi:hypothetical protein